MIFGKSKTPQRLTVHSFQWPEPNRKFQRVRVAIEKVRYSASGSYGHWNLEFEGSTRVESLKDIQFVAALEILDPFETPSRMKEHWREVPESVEGICELQDGNPPLHPSQLNATLYCSSKGVEPALRALAIAAHPASTTIIDLELDRPGALDPDFWTDTWATSILRVRNWRIICESS